MSFSQFELIPLAVGRVARRHVQQCYRRAFLFLRSRHPRYVTKTPAGSFSRGTREETNDRSAVPFADVEERKYKNKK